MNSLNLSQGQHGLELYHEKGNWILKKELGYSPVQLLVASISACGAYVLQGLFDNSKINAKVGDVSTSYDVNPDSKSHELKSVAITFNIHVDQENESKAVSMLRFVNDFCPVIKSLNPEIVITKEANIVR